MMQKFCRSYYKRGKNDPNHVSGQKGCGWWTNIFSLKDVPTWKILWVVNWNLNFTPVKGFLTVVDTIQGTFGFLETKKTSKKKICIWWKQARCEFSRDVVHLFIALVIIEMFFDFYLSVGSESIATHTLTNNIN